MTNTAPGSSPPRVLLVDDDPALLRMLRLIFRTEGFEVLTARDGAEALEVVGVEPLDAIVLDLQMPVMDGRTFYGEARARGIDVPVVILSAYGAEEAMRDLGAPAAVVKPFDNAVLVEAVRRVIFSRAATPSSEDGTSTWESAFLAARPRGRGARGARITPRGTRASSRPRVRRRPPRRRGRRPP